MALNHVAKHMDQWRRADILVHNFKGVCGVEFWLCSLLTLALFGGEWIYSGAYHLVVPVAGL